MSKYSETGEEGTGFEHDDGKGVRECGNCVHMDGEVCKHPVMQAISKEPRDRDNFPIVSKHDCCRFVRRPAK
jgi:hypothetical protein